MRRTTILMGAVVAALALAGGVALAATLDCAANTICKGTKDSDTMIGSSGWDAMYGMGGDDIIRGRLEKDSVDGGKGADRIYGGPGDDEYLWGGGTNRSGPYPDASDDYVHGGDGEDFIYGGFARGGVDRLYGDDGSDIIVADQRSEPGTKVTKEIIDCGADHDWVHYDAGLDVIKNCESLFGQP
jgi:Ca2+-binding RTX toxin-like protein